MSVSRVSALLEVSLSAALYNRVLAKQRSALQYNDDLQLPALMAQDVPRILVFQSFTQHADDLPTQVPSNKQFTVFIDRKSVV